MTSAEAEYPRALRRATTALPGSVRSFIGLAIDSDWFRIEPGAYDVGGPSGGVCPFVAGAVMAGVWWNGAVLAGNAEWGGPDGPTPEIEDFAAYFDLCCDELGTAAALDLVRTSIVFASPDRGVPDAEHCPTHADEPQAHFPRGTLIAS
jgi:hypothetical protein